MSFFSYYKKSEVVAVESPATAPAALDALQVPRREAPETTPLKRSAPVLSKAGSDKAPRVEADGLEDSLRVYKRQALGTPLLTREEEVAVARKVQDGDKEAFEQMIMSNLRLVAKIAQDYERYGMDQLDLISEGNIGLMAAVERFDPDKGAKFSTYAGFWIRQRMRRGLTNQSHTVRLPAHKIDEIAQLKRTVNELEATLGREVSFQEIAEEADMPVKRVRQLLSIDTGTIPLDAPVSPDNDETIGSLVADDESKIPSEISSRRDMQQLAHRYLMQLSERERIVLNRRFGLEGGNPETLEEIGADYNVTRERIRQIEARALANLRKMMERDSKGKEPLNRSLA